MIKRIKVEGFKRLRSFEAHFTEGLNVIRGPNAVGKSTLLQAIAFALYGTNAVAGGAKNLTSWGKKSTKVELELGDGHLIVRTKSNCRVTKDGEEVATGSAVCTKYLEDLMHLPLQEFMLYHMGRQGETAALLTLGAKELERRVEKMSGASVLDEIASKALSDARREQTLAINLAQDLENPEPYENHIKDLKLQIADLQSEQADAQARLNVAESEERDLQAKLSELLEHNRKAQKHQQKLTELRTNKKSLEEQSEEYSKKLVELEAYTPECADNLRGELDQLQTQLQEIKSEQKLYQHRQQKISELQDELETLQEQQDNYLKSRDAVVKLEAQLADLSSEEQDLQQVQAKLLGKAEQAREVVFNLRSTLESAVCPTCQRPLGDTDVESLKKDLQSALDKVSDLENLLELNNIAISQIQNRKQKFQTQLDIYSKWGDLSDSITKVNAELTKLKKEQPDAAPDSTALEVKLESASEEFAEVSDKASQYKVYQRRLRDTMSQLTSVDEELAVLEQQSWDLVDTSALEKRLQSVASDRLNWQMRAGDLSEQVIRLTAEQDKVEQILDGITAQAERIAKLEVRAAKRKELAVKIHEAREAFMERVWRTILGNASNFCRAATSAWVDERNQPRTISNIARKDSKFYFEDGGFETPAVVASGAQRAFLGVGLRLGMATALLGSNRLLILDEPTADMEEKHAFALASALGGLRGQIIMVTHRPYDDLGAANIISIGSSG